MLGVSGVTLEQPEVDGRTQRRTQSLDRAVDAVLDLIASGVPSPTAQQIAERSGISIRTVFRLTQDVESLHLAAVQRQSERVAALYTPLPVAGTASQRIAVLVKSRSSVFEAINPVRRVGEQLALGSPHVAHGLDRHHRLLRTQVASLFAPEFSALGPRDGRDALDAADVAAGWETWEQLRRLKGRTVSDAARVVRHLLSCILTFTA